MPDYIVKEETLTTFADGIRTLTGTSDTYNMEEMSNTMSAIGSMDLTKIASYITPLMFGARADGVTDDTAAINSAIEALTDKSILYFPDGTYLVNSSMSADLDTNNRYYAIKIQNKSNLRLELSPKAKIKHATLSEEEITTYATSRYYIIGIYNSENITINGGCIEGEADTHPYHYYASDGVTYSATHGYGIDVRGSNRVKITNLEVCNCYGDNIHVTVDGANKSKDVLIDNCHIHHGTRLGIGVTGANHVTIRKCDIHDTRGANPQAGIDLESDYDTIKQYDIVVDGCKIYTNASDAIYISKGCIGTKIINCLCLGGIRGSTDFINTNDFYEIINCKVTTISCSPYKNFIIRDCVLGTLGLGKALMLKYMILLFLVSYLSNI